MEVLEGKERGQEIENLFEKVMTAHIPKFLKEIQNKHSSRPVGGAETGTRVERTHVAVAGLRLAECGTNGAGSPSNSRPCGPTFAQINREGRTQSGGE